MGTAETKLIQDALPDGRAAIATRFSIVGGGRALDGNRQHARIAHLYEPREFVKAAKPLTAKLAGPIVPAVRDDAEGDRWCCNGRTIVGEERHDLSSDVLL